MFQYIRALCATVKKQSNEIKELQQKVTNLEQKQKAETEAPVLQTWSMMVSGKKQSEQQQVLIASVNKELREKERIENNVIISGTGAGNSDDQDLAKVDEVLQALNLGASKAKDASRPTGQRERVTQST
jgi:hypoxanthine phosphoribosyltransferase